MKKERDDSFEELQRRKKRKLQSGEDRIKEFNNPAKSTPQSRKANHKKKKAEKRSKRFGAVLVTLQAILSILFLGILINLNLLPFKFTMIIVGVLLLLFLLVLFAQRRQKGKATPTKILSIIICLILALGSYYLSVVNGAFDKVVGGTHKIDNMVVAVLGTDPAETITDAKDYSFGVQYQLGGDDVRSTVADINKTLGSEIAITEYQDIQAQASALVDGSVKAIIYNEGYTGMLEEAIPGYETSVKIIYSYEIEKELISNNTIQAEDVEVKNSTFNVYLSGIDVFGSIKKTSRSDVNIIATVNTETRQILLTTTPRDYYVTIPGVSNGQKDKLTHAGIYGVDASIATLSNLYETTIPFYARVNFTSIIDIVDELGGVDVYSEYAFTTVDGDLTVKQGMNHLNGKQALAFSRERYNVPGGDNQRGKNQQAVIVAMIKKMISPQILTSAADIINSVSGNVETNMSQKQIQEIIKTQLNEGGSWSIYSVAAEGTGGSNYTYSMPGQALYVTEPNMESVQKIISLMERVENNEMLEGSEIAE